MTTTSEGSGAVYAEGFIWVAISDAIYAKAEAKAAEMGTLNNSIRGGKGNLVGFIGEEVANIGLRMLGYKIEENNTFQHDMLLDRVSFEVKTKDRTVAPLLHYEASVANYNTQQSADCYVFVSVTRDKKTNRYIEGFVIGLMPKDEYIRRARFLKKGTVDPSNGWVVSADCHNLPYRALYRFDESDLVSTQPPCARVDDPDRKSERS